MGKKRKNKILINEKGSEDNRAEENEAEANRSEETKSEEIKAEQNKPEETKSEEIKAEQTKPEETKPEETEAEQNEPEETKPEKNEVTEENNLENKNTGQGNTEDDNTEGEAALNHTTETDSGGKQKKKKKWVLPLIIVLFCMFLLLGGAYMGIGVYYQSRFLPNTQINGIDCSGMTAEEAAVFLDAQILGYSLEVRGRDYATGESGALLGCIVPQDIQLTFVDMLGAAEDILDEQEWLLWVRVLKNIHYSYSIVQGVVFDDGMLENVVKSWEACQSGNMLKAQDAYIGEFTEDMQRYEIIPETFSTELDVEQAIQLVAGAVTRGETSLDLEEPGLYGEAAVKRDDSRLTAPVETANLWLSTDIVYDWNGNEVVLDVDTIRDWVTIEDGEAVLDEEAVKSFVKAQSRKYDTYGKTKKFVTAYGVEMKLNSPSYGWRTDTAAETEELVELIHQGSNDPREPVYTHKGMVKGENDIGDSYVEADLTNQHLYLYKDGEIVLETDFVSGRISNGNGTPAGIFGITYKTRNAVLRGADYATPVNYWMPFYGNYGMHDATWRGSFGGDIYLTNGSHGCINLPFSMAEQIYNYVSTGFPVICYYYSEPVAPPDPGTPIEESNVGEEVQ